MQKISQKHLKWIKSLHQKKNRDLEQCFIVEGVKICDEVIQNHPQRIKDIICTNEYLEQISTKLHPQTFTLSPAELSRISTLKTPNAILLVLHKETKLQFDQNKKVILLDDVQDPGNLGTLLRTADWFGITQFVCSLKTVDLYNSKTLQATMGSFLRINVWYQDLDEFLSKNKLEVGGALLEGEEFQDTELQSMNALILGNESRGISEKLRQHINLPLKIKGRGHAESLNVAIAGAIFMEHWVK
jgi:TrmH family RNA methyltransferase